MKHLKRHKVPKKWPVPRKGTTFAVRPSSNLKNGIPVLVILRDMLNLVQNRKEAKKVVHSKNILLNNKIVKDEKRGVVLFDTITIVPAKKYYRLSLSEKGKFETEDIKESDANHKIAKIIDKKMLKGKKVQLNLNDGRNFLSEIKCGVNDSVLIKFKEKKIEKCLPLKEKENAIVLAGKHAGKKGIIEKLDLNRKMAKIKNEEKKINVLIKQIMVIE